MNSAFINKISSAQRALLMQSRTEEFPTTIEEIETRGARPKNCDLYEEFSQSSISETIRLRQAGYGKADAEMRKKLIIAVEEEIADFTIWLSEIKNLEPTIAHFYAVSLKSLLTGFAFGMQVAQLFDVVLNKKV
jgi:hypothetical protein